MHPDANFRNGSGAVTKWRETFQNLSFRLKEMEWARLLQKTRNGSRGINSCIICASITVFATCQVRLRNGMKPPETRVLDVKYVVRNQTDVLEHRNGVQNTQNVTFGPKEVH